MTSTLTPMEVDCPSCAAAHPVDPDRVPSDGVHAICPHCLRTFLVAPVLLREASPAVEEAWVEEAPEVEETPEVAEAEGAPAIEGMSGIEGGDDLGGVPGLDAADADDLPGLVEPPEIDAPPEAGPVEPDLVEEVAPEEAPGRVPPFDKWTFEEPHSGEPTVDAPPPADPTVDAPPPGAVRPDASDPEASDPDAIVTPPPTAESAPAQTEDELQDLGKLASEALEDPDDADRHEDDGAPGAGAAALSKGAARFGRRDPHQRARHLAKVLVSDIIAYYPEKHEAAVARGTVKAEFEEEVEKSRREYVDQVGAELAESTTYFREALNEVLARGNPIY